MTRAAASLRPLLDTVEDALALLDDYRGSADGLPAVSEPLPSLLEQCAALAAATSAAAAPGPVRTIHHLACTGGTLISKCLSLMPNCVVLSEIDPLSRLGLTERITQFNPTDVLLGMRASLRARDDAIVSEVALAAIGRLRDELEVRGQTLVLRDHPHARFCTDEDHRARAGLRDLLARRFEVRSAVTVRHPMDSLLALRHNKWVHYRPDTVEEYCRRTLAFLDAHDGLPTERYEDFVADPEAALARLCVALDLPYRAGTPELVSIVRMSGDSGRRSDEIAPRPRRAVPEAVVAEAATSAAYEALCARLGYDPAN